MLTNLPENIEQENFENWQKNKKVTMKEDTKANSKTHKFIQLINSDIHLQRTSWEKLKSVISYLQKVHYPKAFKCLFL